MPPMVQILVNGEERQVPDGANLRTLLELLRLEGRPVAVEVNRKVIPRARYDETALRNGDIVEVVTFVGGG